MRWKVVRPKLGDVRILKLFLFFPLELGSEKRWLEYVSIKQVWVHQLWHSITFMEEEEVKKLRKIFKCKEVSDE